MKRSSLLLMLLEKENLKFKKMLAYCSVYYEFMMM